MNPTISADSAVRMPDPEAANVILMRWREVGWIALILGLVNGALGMGMALESFVFKADAVADGQWWRLVTHPWVHVSWYHFLLDGGAFLLLYHSLLERRWLSRWLCVAASGAGSLLVSWWLDPNLAQTGLCGLSGIAHGLMAASAVEMMARYGWRSSEGKVGLLTLVAVIGKVLFEAWTGHMFLSFLHFGLMGSPVAVTHAGGVLGGLIWTCFGLLDRSGWRSRVLEIKRSVPFR